MVSIPSQFDLRVMQHSAGSEDTPDRSAHSPTGHGQRDKTPLRFTSTAGVCRAAFRFQVCQTVTGRLGVGSRPEQCVVEDQNDDCANDSDENAVKI